MKHVKKKLLFLANKLIEKIPDSCNTKEHYQSFMTKKKKSVKQSEMITYQGKVFENPDIVDVLQNIQKRHIDWSRL